MQNKSQKHTIPPRPEGGGSPGAFLMKAAINLLPESIVEIISIIGEHETGLLIKYFSGRAVFFPKNPGKNPGAISPSSWATLCLHFGGSLVFIPRCHKSLLHSRNQRIKADRSNGLSIAELTGKYTLTDRQIFSILGKEVNAQQNDLFCL
jgi:hypothetical protein